MKYKIFFIILTLYFIFYIWCNSLEYYIFKKEYNEKYEIKDNKSKFPIVLIIGSTHGNEPAGYCTLQKLKRDIKRKKIKIKNGKLILIPRPNKSGLMFNSRYLLHKFLNNDLNRNYPNSLEETAKDNLSKSILKLIEKSDFVLDLHEGWGFNRINQNSLGSGIYPINNEFSINMANDILQKLNLQINEENKKFVIKTTEHNKDSIDNTLGKYCEMINKNYILVETTGQNNIQKIDIRINQQYFIIKTLLENLGLI